MIEPINNYVLIKASEKQNHISGSDIKIDNSFDRELHISTIGEVVSVPKKINYSSRKAQYYGDYTYSNPYKTDVEVKKGDKVYYNYSEMDTCIHSKRFFIENDEMYAFISYGSIYCIKRGLDIIPCNGHILIGELEANR